MHLAVDAHACVAARREVGEQVAELALAMHDERREQQHPRPFRLGEHVAHDLVGALPLHALAARRAVLHAGTRVEDAQVVEDLGDGADGRARIARGGPLLDGDGRRQPLEPFDRRPLEPSEELTRVGAQALDIAALSLGVEGVEGEGRLARAARTGEDDQGALGQREVRDVEVVLPRAEDLDALGLRGRDGCGHCVGARSLSLRPRPSATALRAARLPRALHVRPSLPSRRRSPSGHGGDLACAREPVQVFSARSAPFSDEPHGLRS